jgi:hypothetical protein
MNRHSVVPASPFFPACKGKNGFVCALGVSLFDFPRNEDIVRPLWRIVGIREGWQGKKKQ